MIGFYDYTVLATYAATALGVTGMFQAVEGRHLTAVFCLLAAGGNTIWACPSQPVPWSFRCFTCWACCCPAGRISWRQECCCWRRCM